MPGAQTIRLIFDHPQRIQRIFLRFAEREIERAQEFVLLWSGDSGQTFHEIVRQQWNFSPQDAPEEVENYSLDLIGVTQMELKIVPERNGGESRATLAQMRLG